jgi:hypothetical protein
MALVKGTNSYAEVAEADAYFETRVDCDKWLNATQADKERVLVTSTALLDDLSWTGIAVSDSQALAFPREGEYFDPRLGWHVTLSGTPDRLLKAVYELSLHLLNNRSVLDVTSTVQDISVGSIKLTNIQQVSKMPSSIRQSLSCLLVDGGARIWWKAN